MRIPPLTMRQMQQGGKGSDPKSRSCMDMCAVRHILRSAADDLMVTEGTRAMHDDSASAASVLPPPCSHDPSPQHIPTCQQPLPAPPMPLHPYHAVLRDVVLS